MSPATAADAPAPTIDVVSTLRDAPELQGYTIDTSGVQLGVVGITASNQRYTHTDTLGYHRSSFPNSSTVAQTRMTVAEDVTYTKSTSTTQTHAVSTGLKTGIKAETKVDFLFVSGKVETSTEFSIGYGYTNTQTSTESTAVTLRVPSQPVTVPPRSTADVSQWVDVGTYSADLAVTGRLAGAVKLSRCGQSVDVPIGVLASLPRDAGRGTLFPGWITPKGDAAEVKTTVAWSTSTATQQLVDATFLPMDTRSTPSATATATPLLSAVASASGPTTAQASAPAASRTSAKSLREVITCPVDAAAELRSVTAKGGVMTVTMSKALFDSPTRVMFWRGDSYVGETYAGRSYYSTSTVRGDTVTVTVTANVPSGSFVRVGVHQGVPGTRASVGTTKVLRGAIEGLNPQFAIGAGRVTYMLPERVFQSDVRLTLWIDGRLATETYKGTLQGGVRGTDGTTSAIWTRVEARRGQKLELRAVTGASSTNPGDDVVVAQSTL